MLCMALPFAKHLPINNEACRLDRVSANDRAPLQCDPPVRPALHAKPNKSTPANARQLVMPPHELTRQRIIRDHPHEAHDRPRCVHDARSAGAAAGHHCHVHGACARPAGRCAMAPTLRGYTFPGLVRTALQGPRRLGNVLAQRSGCACSRRSRPTSWARQPGSGRQPSADAKRNTAGSACIRAASSAPDSKAAANSRGRRGPGQHARPAKPGENR